MTKQIVCMKYNQSIPQVYEAEAFVIDTTNIDDLDELFKEALQRARDQYERNLEENMAADDGSLFINMWLTKLDHMNVVTTSDWRHSKGANHTAVISPAKDSDGNYLPLSMEDKWGCLNDVIIAHGYLQSDYAHDIHDYEDPVIDKAIGSYWEWLESTNRLNYSGLAEIQERILI